MANFQHGDEITVAGLYADGTQAPNKGPYNEKPLQLWRLEGPAKSDNISAYRLIPIPPKSRHTGHFPSASASED